MGMPSSWNLVDRELVLDCPVFKVFRDHNIHPLDFREGDFFILESRDWVTVLPRTSDGKFILVRQYRMGIKKVCWEFPGGVIDDGESPDVAAKRELAEETGFTGNTPISLGNISPNPALFNNRVHYFFIENCKCTQAVDFDANEELETKLVSSKELREMFERGEIDHALMLGIFAKFLFKYPEVFKEFYGE